MHYKIFGPDGSAQLVGTRRLCSQFYLLCYAALLKNLPIMLKFMLNTYLLCSNYAQLFMPQFSCSANKAPIQ